MGTCLELEADHVRPLRSCALCVELDPRRSLAAMLHGARQLVAPGARQRCLHLFAAAAASSFFVSQLLYTEMLGPIFEQYRDVWTRSLHQSDRRWHEERRVMRSQFHEAYPPGQPCMQLEDLFCHLLDNGMTMGKCNIANMWACSCQMIDFQCLTLHEQLTIAFAFLGTTGFTSYCVQCVLRHLQLRLDRKQCNQAAHHYRLLRE